MLSLAFSPSNSTSVLSWMLQVLGSLEKVTLRRWAEVNWERKVWRGSKKASKIFHMASAAKEQQH